jgi:hypothetical protein
MSAKIKYSDEPISKIQVIPELLPSPAELIYREDDFAKENTLVMLKVVGSCSGAIQEAVPEPLERIECEECSSL